MYIAANPATWPVIWRDIVAVQLFSDVSPATILEEYSTIKIRHYLTVARSGNVYVAGMVEIPAATDGTKLSRWLPYVSVADVDEAQLFASCFA